MSRDLACEELFPNLEPRAAARSLSKALSMARTALAELGEAGAALLGADLTHLWLAPGIAVDADELTVALEQRLIFTDFFFDLVVIRQPFAGNTALADYLPCRFTLGRCVVQTVFSDHPGSRDGDFLAHALRIEM